MALAAFIAVPIICGCDDSPTTLDPDQPDIASRVVVLTGEQGLRLHGVDGSSYIYRVLGGYPEIKQGTVLIGSEMDGYIRRVLSISRSGNVLTIETEAASLAEAVISGSTDTVIRFDPQGLLAHADMVSDTGSDPSPRVFAAAGAIGFDLAGLTLYSGEHEGVAVAVAFTAGRFEFTPELSLHMRFRDNSIEEFRAIENGIVSIDSRVSVSALGAVDLSRETKIASLEFRNVHHIGYVPIVEVIEVSFSAGFTLSSRAESRFSTAFAGVYRSRIGSNWRHGAWSDMQSNAPEIESYSFTYQGSTPDCEIAVYIRPALHVRYYGEDGSSLTMGAFHGLDAEVRTPPDWRYEITTGISGRVDHALTILDRGIASHTADPLDFRTVLDTGPFATEFFIYLTSWGIEGTEPGQFRYPKGIALDAGRAVYIVDHWNHNIQEFGPDGSFVRRWGTEGSIAGQMKFPKQADIGPSGSIYVVDSGNYRIEQFAPDTALIATWGYQGSGDGAFQNPEGVAVDAGGFVYVTDYQRHIVQKFTPGGDFVISWGGQGTDAGSLNGPTGIAVGPDGNIYVAECHNNRIQKFTMNGGHLLMWGGAGTGPGEFNCPIDLAVAPGGNVLIVDYGNARIQEFTSEGVFVAQLGGLGSDTGAFDHPEGIAVDSDGSIYVVDSRNHRVQKFAPINR
jgi:DNA-binding beta-propeller fold protein YncE